jgi:hypothetical protein
MMMMMMTMMMMMQIFFFFTFSTASELSHFFVDAASIIGIAEFYKMK